MSNFYLFNGKDGKGQSLNILANGKLQREFYDIAELDFHTMSIPRDEANEKLSEYNPFASIDGFYYELPDHQSSKKITVYHPIFDCKSEKGKKYLDKLKYFAEMRMYNIKETGKKGKFSFQDDKYLNDLIRSLLYNICLLDKGDYNQLLDERSIIAKKIKECLADRYNKYSMSSTNKYINYELYGNGLGNVLGGYPALRNLVLAYILLTEKEDIKLNPRLHNATKYDNNFDIGFDPMEVFEPKEEIKEEVYEQMQLSEFMCFPQLRPVEKSKRRVKK